jgi:hypothetical protein
MWRVTGLAVWLFATPPLAAQWSAGVEVAMLKFSGTSIDTATSGDPARARPSPSTSYAVRVERQLGRVGVGIGFLYSKGGGRVENTTNAVDEKELLKLYELTPEVSFLVARPDRGGALRVYVGPLFDRWWFMYDEDTRWRLGARAAVGLDWSLGGRCSGTLRGEGAASAGVFGVEHLPPGFARRTTWRRAVSAGVRVRL